MAMIQTISCDICGTPKREANHWFTYSAQAGHVAFYPWTEENYRVHNHLCSERCCMTVLSRTLSNWGRREAA